MFGSVVDICVAGISSCFSWFEGILTATGATSFILGFALIFMTYKFILQPMFGRAGKSDRAEKKNSKKE